VDARLVVDKAVSGGWWKMLACRSRAGGARPQMVGRAQARTGRIARSSRAMGAGRTAAVALVAARATACAANVIAVSSAALVAQQTRGDA
jgi:hypothetical protein